MAGLQYREGPRLVLPGYETSGSANDWYAGDPVIVSSGLLVIATSGADVWGIATAPATGTENTKVMVEIALPGTIWSVNVDAATTPAQASHVGVSYDLSISAGATLLDLASGTAAGWVVVALDTRDTPAAGTRVLVTPQYASCDAIGG